MHVGAYMVNSPCSEPNNTKKVSISLVNSVNITACQQLHESQTAGTAINVWAEIEVSLTVTIY